MLKKYTKGSWPSLVTIETMRKLALHSDPFRDAPLARYLGFKCKVCPTILPYLVYRTNLQFSSKLIYRSQVHCYHVVQLVAKLEGRNCVLTQRKAHQKLDVSTEVPTVSYLKGRIADTSYILCDKELRLAYLANRSRDRARIGEIVNKMTSFTR